MLWGLQNQSLCSLGILWLWCLCCHRSISALQGVPMAVSAGGAGTAAAFTSPSLRGSGRWEEGECGQARAWGKARGSSWISKALLPPVPPLLCCF